MIVFEKAMQMTPMKLRIIAKISKGMIDSERKSQPRIAAQMGAVLKIVYCTTRGTRATPKVMVVNPIVPMIHLMASTALSPGIICQSARKHKANIPEPINMTSVR